MLGTESNPRVSQFLIAKERNSRTPAPIAKLKAPCKPTMVVLSKGIWTEKSKEGLKQDRKWVTERGPSLPIYCYFGSKEHGRNHASYLQRNIEKLRASTTISCADVIIIRPSYWDLAQIPTGRNNDTQLIDIFSPQLGQIRRKLRRLPLRWCRVFGQSGSSRDKARAILPTILRSLSFRNGIPFWI